MNTKLPTTYDHMKEGRLTAYAAAMLSELQGQKLQIETQIAVWTEIRDTFKKHETNQEAGR